MDISEVVNLVFGVVTIGGIGALRTLIKKEISQAMAPLAQRVRQLELVHDAEVIPFSKGAAE